MQARPLSENPLMKHPHNRERLKEYLDGIVAGKYKQTQVAMWTSYSREHICRLTKRYKKEGSSCLVNGRKGKAGPRAIPQEVKDKIVNIYRRDFVAGGVGTQFSVFRDCLESGYGINYSYRAVYNVLTAAGIESPEKRKKGRKKARRPRQRKASEGELVQIDASSYKWLERTGDEEYYALHGAIDDATGQIAALCFAKNECSYGYYSVLEEAIEKRGQWQRVLSGLEIGQILAWSPQAKGRVEGFPSHSSWGE